LNISLLRLSSVLLRKECKKRIVERGKKRKVIKIAVG